MRMRRRTRRWRRRSSAGMPRRLRCSKKRRGTPAMMPEAWNLYASAMRTLRHPRKAVSAARNAVAIARAREAGRKAALDLAVDQHALASALIEADELTEAEQLLVTVTESLRSPHVRCAAARRGAAGIVRGLQLRARRRGRVRLAAQPRAAASGVAVRTARRRRARAARSTSACCRDAATTPLRSPRWRVWHARTRSASATTRKHSKPIRSR